MPLIQLNINSPQEQLPLLENIVDREKMLWHISQGNIRQVDHPDGVTRLFTYTEKCARERIWDRVTTRCRGIIVREGRVIARPWGKFFQMNTQGLPETQPEHWPRETPEITEMLDGEQCVGYEDGKSGRMCLAGRYGFINLAIGWGTRELREKENKHGMSWPSGYTPVFQACGEGWRRIREQKENRLYLMAMVRNEDGDEMSREGVLAWGVKNNLLTPLDLQFSRGSNVVEAVLRTENAVGRGWVLRWRQHGAEPFRVIVRDEGYEKLRNLVRTCTPMGIWEMMSMGAELGPLGDNRLPPGFRAWVKGWEIKIQSRKWNVEWDARAVWRRLEASKLVHGALWDRMCEMTKGEVDLRPVVVELMKGRDVEAAVWRAVRGVCEGEEGYSRGGV